MRALRARYRVPLMKEAFRFAAPDESVRDSQLRDYLRAANFEITDMAPGVPLVAHLAHYAQTSLVTVSAPAITVKWKRDEASRGRALMIFARRGELDASSSAPVIRRGRSALLIPPGDTPIEIRATGAHNELIYVSTGAHIIPPPAARLRQDVLASRLPWRMLAPLYGFVEGLCRTPPLPPDEPDLLPGVTNVIVEALARTAFWDITPVESPVERAHVFIRENHQNPQLSSAAIAEHLRMPLRTLQAAFSAEGLTLSSELRRARIETAMRLMRTNPELSQARRAYLSGFSSESALYRALRAHSQPTDTEPPT